MIWLKNASVHDSAARIVSDVDVRGGIATNKDCYKDLLSKKAWLEIRRSDTADIIFCEPSFNRCLYGPYGNICLFFFVYAIDLYRPVLDVATSCMNHMHSWRVPVPDLDHYPPPSFLLVSLFPGVHLVFIDVHNHFEIKVPVKKCSHEKFLVDRPLKVRVPHKT